jgi:two-component system response regulator YesN
MTGQNNKNSNVSDIWVQRQLKELTGASGLREGGPETASFPIVGSVEQRFRQLTRILTAFSHVSGMPVEFYDRRNIRRWECLEEKKICRIFPDHSSCSSCCDRDLEKALKTALDLGEPYLFYCDAGLIRIAYPFCIRGECRGCFFAGPVTMNSNRRSAVNRLSNTLISNSSNSKYTSQIISFLSTMDVYTPMEITYMYEVFCNSVFSAQVLESSFGLTHITGETKDRTEEGAKTPDTSSGSSERSSASAVDMSKLQPADHSIDGSEEALLRAVQIGNEAEAVKVYRNLSSEVYILESGSLVPVRDRLVSMLARLLVRVRVDSICYSECLEQMEKLHGAFTFSQVMNISLDIVSSLTSYFSKPALSDLSPVVQEMVAYIDANYASHITLESAAAAVHGNVTYISSLFHKETGQTFTAYLTQRRIENSLPLLKETHLSVAEIAQRCGFTSQSYFSKLFRSRMGMTPAKFRR